MICASTSASALPKAVHAATLGPGPPPSPMRAALPRTTLRIPPKEERKKSKKKDRKKHKP